MWVLESGIVSNVNSKQACYVTERVRKELCNTIIDDEDLLLFISEINEYVRNANAEFSRCKPVSLRWYETGVSTRFVYVIIERKDRGDLSVANYTLRYVEKKIF